jgi:hypothetical protein
VANSSAHALRDLAEVHLGAVLKQLPSDRIGRFVLFIEVVRAMDYWGTHAPALIGDSEEVAQSIDLMYWGWNRAVAGLFEPLDQPGAFLLTESTQESHVFATGLMQEFGKVSLMRRLADMSERGIMEIMRDGDEFQIKMGEGLAEPAARRTGNAVKLRLFVQKRSDEKNPRTARVQRRRPHSLRGQCRNSKYSAGQLLIHKDFLR